MEITVGNMEAYLYASDKHKSQKRSGTDIPYFNHCLNVREFVLQFIEQQPNGAYDKVFAENVALLHDVLEDTNATFGEIAKKFGSEIADAVKALTKNKQLDEDQQLLDSLQRIAKQRKEVALVKMADRIDNLSALNPVWDKDRAIWYVNQSLLIVDKLQQKDERMTNLLIEQIEKYMDKIHDFEQKGGYMNFLQAKQGYLFAYDTSTGTTLKFVKGKWSLSEISYVELSRDEDIMQISQADAKKIYKDENPQKFIDEFIKSLE